MSGFLLGLLVGAWAGFLFGMVFLAAWINIKRVDRQDDDERFVASHQCAACGAFSSRTGVILHYRGCSQESPVRQAFL